MNNTTYGDLGSYIELELNTGNELFKNIDNKDIIRLNTCRAAIYHAVRCYNVKKVWLAKYQCDVVRNFLIKKGIEVLVYEIDSEFNPILEKNSKDSAIVLTNYFGIFGDSHFDKLVPKYNNVIIDNALALFYPPRNDCLNCYSPRKFVAAPDGGYVIGNNVNKFEYPQDKSSNTSQFLLMRYEYGVQGEGYANKKMNDKRIDESDILLMSPLTYALLDSYNYNEIIKKRQKNFKYSRKLFDRYNLIDIECIADPNCAPMGYPLFMKDVEIIPEFHKNHIYQARYWEYLLDEIETESFEYQLVKHLALICTDQRYDEDIIDYQLQIVENLLKKYKL